MIDSLIVISVNELCRYCDIDMENLVAIVEHGILEPREPQQGPEDWVFDSTVISVTRSAVRLQRDLGVNWAGVALALELISQREQLHRENKLLRSRLSRFLTE